MYTGRPSRSSVEMGVFEKYFLYQFVNFFIFTIFSGAVFTTFTDLVDNPGAAPTLFGQSVPTVSTQFINYIVTRNFLMQPLKLLAYDDLLLNSIGAMLASSPRQKQRALNNLTNPSFGSDLPINICIWIIAFTYCTIAPILVPFAVVFFGCGYIISKYQALYMNVAKYETGGQFWPKCFNRMVSGIIVAELAMIGIFGVKKAAIQSVLVIPLLIGTLVYVYIMNSTFTQWRGLLPIEAALTIDRARIDNKQLLIESDDVRDYASTTGVSPYRQPELLAPRNLQPFYSDPLTILQACISEGGYNDLGESTRADIPSRLELLHEQKLESDDNGIGLFNLSQNNLRKRYSVIHTEHYDRDHRSATPTFKGTTTTAQPSYDNTINSNNNIRSINTDNTAVNTNNLSVPINSISQRTPSGSTFNDSRQSNYNHINPHISAQKILDMHSTTSDQGESNSNATDFAARIDVQHSVPDEQKYTQTTVTSDEDVHNTTNNADENRSEIATALDAV